MPRFLLFLVVSIVLVLCTQARADALPRLERTAVNATALYPDGAGSPDSVPVDGSPVSVASRRIAGLEAGETLAVSAEIEATSDVIVRDGSGYRWLDVPLTSRIVLADSPDATDGVELAPVAGGMIAWRQHHADVVRDALYRVPAEMAGRDAYVNIVLAAPMASPPSTCAQYDRARAAFGAAPGCALHVESDRGLVDLGVTRSPAPAGGYAVEPLGTGSAGDARLPIPSGSGQPGYGQQTVIWSSARLTDVSKGDVLEAGVQMAATIRGLAASLPAHSETATGCNVMLTGRFYLSPYPDRLPEPGDPRGNAVPALDSGHAFNLTQDEPAASPTWHTSWQADGRYTGDPTPERYIVLAAWASGGDACRAGSPSEQALSIEGAGSSGYALRLRATAPKETGWGQGASATAGNAATRLAGDGRRVLAVVPVRLQAGDVLVASGEAQLLPSAVTEAGAQLVVGSSYSGPDDTSGTPLDAGPGASLGRLSGRALLARRGELLAGPDDAGLRWVKLVAWADRAVGYHASRTRALVRLMRSGSAPGADDLPAPPAPVGAGDGPLDFSPAASSATGARARAAIATAARASKKATKKKATKKKKTSKKKTSKKKKKTRRK